MHDENGGPPPQPGSMQSRSMTVTTVSSSALMTVRTCTFSSSAAASLRRFDVFLGKKKAAMDIRQPDGAHLAASFRVNVITLHSRDQSTCVRPGIAGFSSYIGVVGHR
jgi:hypothetical protein